MHKFMNDPDSFVEDSLEGILEAYPQWLRAHPEDRKAICLSRPSPRRVSVVTGGGFGHLPLFLGYVGEGLCDGAAVGNIFSTPGAGTICAVTRSVEHREGVLYLLGNYTGDLMNFELAAGMMAQEGIATELVLICDDMATAPRSDWQNRRATSGLVFACKLAGAAARRGLPLHAVAELVRRANRSMASYGVAVRSCQLPGTASPVFELPEEEMELGVGIHGEPGVERTRAMSSRETVRAAARLLAADLSLRPGERVAALVNGLGATSREELFILYRDLCRELRVLGLEPARSFVGEYAACLEMGGASFTLLRLDEELLALLDEPAHSPFVSFQPVLCDGKLTKG